MVVSTRGGVGMQRAGGFAALYIALAYLAAIPYFLVLVNYPSVVDPVQKVNLLRDHYVSMHLMHLFSYEFVAIGLIVVTLALYHSLKERAPSTAQVAAVVGFVWATLLLASVMVFTYGMRAVVQLYATEPGQAVSAWQVIEPVAEALGGSGGEILGGIWILLLSAAGLRTMVFPRTLNWLGVGIGVAGIASLVPVLNGLAVAFGVLQIVWFAWLGIVLVRPGAAGTSRSRRATAAST